MNLLVKRLRNTSSITQGVGNSKTEETQHMKFILKFLKRRRLKMLSLFFPWTVTSDDLITSVYGGNFTPSAESTQRREQKVQECITTMGDKYLLAQPVERPKNA
jgi:hypothetical protein